MVTKINDIYQLSPMQEGMFFHYLSDKESNLYHEYFTFDIKGDFNKEIFIESFNTLIQEHECLRTIFTYKNSDQPLQVILSHRKIDVPVHDIKHLSAEAQEMYVKQSIREEKDRYFNLEKDLLIRCTIYKLSDHKYKLFLSFHHIILDGWSFSLLLKDLLKKYERMLSGENAQNGYRYSYGQYINWMSKQNKHDTLDFWENYLDGYEDVAILPRDQHITANDRKMVDHTFFADSILTKKLQDYAIEKRVTMNTILQLVWGLLLQKYNYTKDVVFGSVVSGRSPEIPHIDKMLGLFINTIPVRVNTENVLTFEELVMIHHLNNLNARKHEHASLAEIQNNMPQKSELINSIIVFENYPISDEIEQLNKDNKLGFIIEHVDIEENTNYDINLIINPDTQMKFTIKYNENLYSRSFIKQIESQMRLLLNNICENSPYFLEDINVMTGLEQKVIDKANQTYQTYSEQETIIDLFEKVVKKHPHKIAIVSDDESYSYQVLSEQINKIYCLLKRYDIKQGDSVALIMDKSLQMIASKLAILKLGATYVPIDVNENTNRMTYIVEDSNSKIVLTNKSIILQQKWPVPTIDVNLAAYEDITKMVIVNNSRITYNAYVIYTSGSTGQPKGVVIPQKNILRVVLQTNYINITEEDTLLQLSNYSFDGAVFDIYGALLNGATLCLIDTEDFLNFERLNNIITKHKVSISFMTTALFNTVVENKIECLQPFRKILFGGERVSYSHVQKALDYLGEDVLIHVYGPTESTVFSTFYPINHLSKMDSTVPIGRPITNTRVFILDKYLQQVPIGGIGELYISGDGLASGYLNNEDLTKTSFVENPFEPNSIMYKTGDLVKMGKDGNIIFLDRIDHQVKLRGFRIELGEIEKKLVDELGVKEAVVLPERDKNGNVEKLIAYVVSDKEIISSELTNLLPYYMIPEHILTIDKIPLNKSGKIDKSKLPNIEEKRLVEESRDTDENEQEMIEIWKEVLGLHHINVDDNFFEIGGHSLKASMLVSKIHKQWDVKLEIKDLYKYPVLKDLVIRLKKSNKNKFVHIEKAKKKTYYNLSFPEKRMYTMWNMQRDSTFYNIPSAFSLKGNVDKERLQDALIQLIARHESLRTTYHMVNDVPKKRINKQGELFYKEINIKDTPTQQAIEHVIQPFNLEKGPLFRVFLLEKNEEDHILVFDFHHIIADGTSTGILINEFSKLYSGQPLEQNILQYKDFSEWQLQSDHSKERSEDEKYWMDKFSDDIPTLSLPLDANRSNKQTYSGHSLSVTMKKNILKQLKSFSRESNVSLYSLLLASFNILLGKYSGQEDIVVGTSVEGRNHEDLRQTVGMFVNTLALRNKPASDKIFNDFLLEVNNNFLEDIQHQNFPFDELVSKLNIPRESGRNPLFDVMFVMQNAEINEIQMDDVLIKDFSIPSQIEKFDLTLQVVEEDKGLHILLSYSNELFSEQQMQMFLDNYVNLLSKISDVKDNKISDISVISEKEINYIYNDFNDTRTEYHSSVINVFEKIVKQFPERTAIQNNKRKVTYKELDILSNQLANYLVEMGITKQDIVGITGEKTVETIISILGIVKCGAIYLPIDMDNPTSRIKGIVKDADPKVIINTVDSELANTFQGKCINLPNWDEYDKTFNGPSTINGSAHLYISYTSGSTGEPKGVVIRHKSAARLVLNNNYIQWKSSDKLLHTSSLAFDAHTFEIWGSLLNGITLCIESKDLLLNSESLKNYIKQENITIMWLTSPLFNQMCQADPTMFEPLRYLITGGDVVSPKFVNKARKYAPDLIVINGYGPTENTTFSLTYQISESLKDDENVPIGKPIANSTVFILDKNEKLVPIGAIGEIYVGGDGIASGYLNNPELTKERFVKLNHISDQLLYRTGDIGRLTSAGDIEFLGRNDNQIKIRGYRIEIGEIKGTLLKHIQELKDIVIIFDKENEQLIAYYILKNKINSSIRDLASLYLADYMIPTFFIELEEFPLTINGKIDIKQLPKPEFNQNDQTEDFQSEQEKVIASIWTEVLKHKVTSRHDNFFEIGGDSIKGIQMIGKLRKIGIRIEISDLIKYPTIAQIVNYTKDIEIISQEEVVGSVNKIPIQIQYIDLNKNHFNHFNQSVFLFNPNGINENAAEHAIRYIVQHHDALRITYRNSTSTDLMINPVNSNYSFEVKRMTCEKKINDVVENVQQSMDLVKGPLVKAVLFKTDQGDHLLIVIHHLVVDGVSWRIILEDFYSIYHQLIEGGSKITLQEKTNSVIEWANELVEYSQSEELFEEIDYWKNIARKEKNILPFSTPSNRRKWKNRKTYTLELSEEQTEILLYDTPKVFGSRMNDILLSALRLTIQQIFPKEESVNVLLEGHGRHSELFNIDISRTVGWFTILYPINLPINNNDNISEVIAETQDVINAVPNDGIGWGLLKDLSPYSKQFENYLYPQISFNYLGQIDSDVQQNDFNHSPFSTGHEIGGEIVSLTALDINSLIIDQKLRINFSVDRFETDQELLHSIGNNYVKNLEEIIKRSKQADSLNIEREKIDEIYNQPSIVLLNEKKEHNLFVFPPHMPQIGYSIIYKNLSMYVHTHSFYMFNFVEHDDILNYYADQVINIQPEGSYTFLGYSFGGTIATEVARILSKRGYTVNDIILVDSYVVEKDSFNHINLESIESSVHAEVTGDFSVYMDLDESLRQEIVDSFIKYYQYTKDIVNISQPIASNLHLLKVEGKVEHLKDTRPLWRDLTLKEYLEYSSFGEHEQMLTGEYLPKNAKIISGILKNVVSKKLKK